MWFCLCDGFSCFLSFLRNLKGRIPVFHWAYPKRDTLETRWTIMRDIALTLHHPSFNTSTSVMMSPFFRYSSHGDSGTKLWMTYALALSFSGELTCIFCSAVRLFYYCSPWSRFTQTYGCGGTQDLALSNTRVFAATSARRFSYMELAAAVFTAVRVRLKML